MEKMYLPRVLNPALFNKIQVQKVQTENSVSNAYKEWRFELLIGNGHAINELRA